MSGPLIPKDLLTIAGMLQKQAYAKACIAVPRDAENVLLHAVRRHVPHLRVWP